jgi:phosphatidylglycerophosphate synthase
MSVASVRARRTTAPATGLLAQVLLLGVLAEAAGLGPVGWLTGIACAVTIAVALARGLARGERLGPASWVTLARATLAVGVAALVADSFTRETPVALLVTLSAIALALDLADGYVARRTATETPLGARFDGEVDAFLILALSVYASPEYGAWVLAIGAARYVFLAGGLLLPWMRAPLPPRRWRRLVAAAQGVVLAVAAADVLPRAITQALLAAALVLLAASMGECTWWLWRRRHAAVDRRRPLPTGFAAALTVLALALVWVALVAPHQPGHFSLGAFGRLPLELLVAVALAAVLPATPRRVLAVIAGAVLSALVVVKVLDIGFFTAFDRPFKPVDDSTYVGIGIETLRDAIGSSSADLVVVAAAVFILALLAVPVLALVRVMRVAAGRPGWALRAVAVLGVVWVALRIAGAPVASSSAAALTVDEVHAVRAGLQDRAELARELSYDRFAATPADRLLTGLRGKDVMLVFVESYGRVAVQDSAFSPRVDAVLHQGDAQLRSAGFASRSAFLTSPTFGGLSWLAHSTLQSGIRVDGQRRYDTLVKHDRLTLTSAFKRAGWRAVGVMPANHRAWPEGFSYYRYDAIYDRRNLGYRGPDFGLPPMPDQYAFLALQRRELAKRGRPPLFAEVDLISSHAPWTKIPRLIPWRQVGDGSAFGRIPAEESTKASLFGDAARARTAYGHSIEYSMRALFSFVHHYGDKNLVLVVLGDHQPATLVTGQGATHDVPISVIAHDPKVLDQISGWGWQDGMLPSPQAPVWPMDAFRDRFLGAFSR